MTKHTPTPWFHEYEDHYSIITVVGLPKEGEKGFEPFLPADKVICHEVSKANAAFIVRACNSYDDLVNAMTEYFKVDGGSGSECYSATRYLEARKKCFEALAKAKGEV